MIDIVLMRPEVPGNIGAVARAMANFNFSRLVIVSPACEPHSKEALDRAKHARLILKKAKIVDDKILAAYDYRIGTTAQLGTDYNIPRSPLRPSQLAQKLSEIKKARVALIFGPEGQGLTNKEILSCDFIVTIPSSPKNPVLNLSHAVAVLLYEIFSKSSSIKTGDQIKPMTATEKKHLLALVEKTLVAMPFRTEDERETQRRVWKRMVGKAMLTKREAYALFGFLKMVGKK